MIRFALAPHDQRDLAVGLEADEAVDDVHARVLQRARPLDVGRLVEARLQLDDGRDLLAVLGGADERADDGRVGAGAVERLLDGEHVGIVGRLRDELDHVLERLVGVLQQDVALGDDAEDVVVLLQRRHDLRRERLVACTRAGPRARADGHEVGQVQRPVEQVDVVGLEAQRRAQEGDHLGGRVVRDLEAHGAAALAPPQLLLDRLEQVVGLVLVDR